MTVKDLQVWAVIALWAVAAGSSLAAGEMTIVNSPGWGRMEVPVTWLEAPVAVDKSYAEEHPEQRVLQAVVAADREVLRDHESRIDRLENPAQSQGGDNQPATAPAGSEVSSMLTIEMFAGTLGALGLLGILIWIAVNTGRREENYGLATLTQALNMGEGEIRGSATAPDGRSVAFRVEGVNAQAQAAAIAAAQGANPSVQPAQGAQGATPAQPGTPAQGGPSLAAITAARAGLIRAGWARVSLAAALYVAGQLEAAGVDLNNATAVDRVIAIEQAAGNI